MKIDADWILKSSIEDVVRAALKYSWFGFSKPQIDRMLKIKEIQALERIGKILEGKCEE